VSVPQDRLQLYIATGDGNVNDQEGSLYYWDCASQSLFGTLSSRVETVLSTALVGNRPEILGVQRVPNEVVPLRIRHHASIDPPSTIVRDQAIGRNGIYNF
jgi:hypothetical protein